jgi:tetratricopeptide (TPR) repeat protein
MPRPTKRPVKPQGAELLRMQGIRFPPASHYERQATSKSGALFDRGIYRGVSLLRAQSPDRTKKLNEFSVKAGNYYFKSGDFAKAAEAFSRCKAYSQAGEAALSAGEKERAADYFTAGKEFDKAARIYSDMGNIRKASEVLAEQAIENGDDVKGAALYMDAGDFLKAAELFEKAGNFSVGMLLKEWSTTRRRDVHKRSLREGRRGIRQGRNPDGDYFHEERPPEKGLRPGGGVR